MSSPTDSSSSSSWQDRRGMFQSGKHVHEPGKIQGGSSVVDAVRRASISSQTEDAAKPADAPQGPAGRRRSSGQAFSSLEQLKRGSQDYGERRTSHSEMAGPQGLVSGWFNKTFRGMSGPNASAPGPAIKEQPEMKQEPRRGVMDWLETRTDSV